MPRGRVPIEGVARDVMVNFKVTPEEDDQLKELVEASGMSKSELIRIVLKRTWEHMKKGYAEATEKTQKLIKEGKLNPANLSAMFKEGEDKLERTLNADLYSKVVEAQDRKRKK